VLMCVCVCVRAHVTHIWNSIDRFVRDFCEHYVTGGRWNALRSVKNIMQLPDARYCDDVVMLASLSCSLWKDVWKEAFVK
jgi:hypothetical protein